MLNIEKYNKEEYPLWRINIRVQETDLETVNLRNIFALFLSYYPNQYLAYSIENDNILDQLKRFLVVNKSDLDKINIHFDLPRTIMSYDESFITFQHDFMKLKYGYYMLKENYNMLDSMTIIESDNPHFQAAQSRRKINKKSLSKVISAYEMNFNELLEKL